MLREKRAIRHVNAASNAFWQGRVCLVMMMSATKLHVNTVSWRKGSAMTGEPTFRFVVPEPFDKAVKLVYRQLLAGGLVVRVDLNLSARIRGELGIQLSPCRLLCVDSPLSLVEAMTLDDAAAVFLPLHVVVTGHGSHTLVQFISTAHICGSALPVSTKVPMNKLQTRIAEAMEKIGLRNGNGR